MVRSFEDAKAKVLEAIAERSETPKPKVTGVVDGIESFREAAVDGLLLRSGISVKDADKSGGNNMRSFSLLEIGRQCLAARGEVVSGLYFRFSWSCII